jgi:hypothetical protein
MRSVFCVRICLCIVFIRILFLIYGRAPITIRYIYIYIGIYNHFIEYNIVLAELTTTRIVRVCSQAAI